MWKSKPHNRARFLRGPLVSMSLVFPFSAALGTGDPPCPFESVTERIFVIVGSDHRRCPRQSVNYPLTNPAAIIGETGVILIDPGSSLQAGRLVLERLQTITDKPVIAVFNSHIHGLYWLGNQAIGEAYPEVPIYAHERMIARINQGEGDFWVKAITGDHDGETTRFILPDHPLLGGETLTLAGIDVKVHHFGHGHTDHDLVLEVPSERAVFLGGLVVEPEVPSQGVPSDADFEGQIAATREAIALDADTFIPGRGHPAGDALPERALAFLTALYDGTAAGYDAGLTDFEVTQELKEELADYQAWYDFDQLGGVVSQMYLQVERDQF
ncbi:MBL fold metallo-hydrolase [Thiocapsa bogorovii]|uniref:MBL fold metallo-hydrolase n=1 Tax=Thiocapsa bogorovii TaxID=521689 RepID=UPI001E2DE906|nr:MBL fold metallo-hydrolase [Thiocapsa bogorovii]UHD17887.1 MBL fold metallo-hydrolase [Thiocapsa bogorovii]